MKQHVLIYETEAGGELDRHRIETEDRRQLARAVADYVRLLDLEVRSPVTRVPGGKPGRKENRRDTKKATR